MLASSNATFCSVCNAYNADVKEKKNVRWIYNKAFLYHLLMRTYLFGVIELEIFRVWKNGNGTDFYVIFGKEHE